MTTTVITLSDKPCVHNAPEYVQAQRKANSYICPVGPIPGRAWVLMIRSEWDKIKTNTSHTLKFAGSRASASIGSLYAIKADRLLAGQQDDSNAILMIELADKRILLERFTDTLNESYNIRSYASPTRYLTGTAQASWTAALSDLWSNVSTLAGSYPGLPYVPPGVPEDFQFLGVNAWAAIHEMLGVIGCTTAYDPLQETFSIVRVGASQSVSSLPTPIFDAEIATGVGPQIPATVRVYFHDSYRSYGQERDTELATNWAATGPSTISNQATGVSGVVSGTVVPIWTHLARELDENNSDANAADRTTWAALVATNYLLDKQTGRSYTQYEGVLTDVLPGSQVKAVMWRHWGDHLGATVTEILQHPGVPTSIDQTDKGPSCCLKGLGENIAPPDIGRKTFPNYPRLPNIVRVIDAGEDAGQFIQPNASDLHPGTVKRWVAGSMATLDDCWIKFVDDWGNQTGDIGAVNGEYYGPARLCGLETHSADQRPLYLVRRGMIASFGSLGGPAVAFNPFSGVATQMNFSETLGAPIHTTVTTGAAADITVDIPGDYMASFSCHCLPSGASGNEEHFDKTGGGSAAIDVLGTARFELAIDGVRPQSVGNYTYQTQASMSMINDKFVEVSMGFHAPITLAAGEAVSIFVEESGLLLTGIQINDAALTIELIREEW